MIIAGTGHRPDGIAEPHDIVTLKARVKLQQKATRFICGMAAGFDLLAAKAAMELKLPITAAQPWTTHYASIPEEWFELWEEVYHYADVKHVVVESMKFPGNHAYFKRNHWMVDNADAVMAYWDGRKEGGTYECRNYAKDKGVPVANIINDPPF